MKSINLFPQYIFYGGNVHTVDSSNAIVEAIAILGQRIMATGTTAEILTLAGPKTVKIDLKGRSLIPGIIDSHNHAWEAGRLLEGVVTFGIQSFAELRERIAEKLVDLPEGTWLQGGGWIETQFVENRMPTRWDLDAVSPNHPVVLERIFSTCVCNSMALALAGITKETPDPPAGEIGRDPQTGEPNGLLFRAGKQLVRDVMPGPFGATAFGFGEGIEQSVKRAQEEYLSYGITGIVEPGVSPAICRAYQNLYKRGQLKMRFNLMPNYFGFHIKQELDHMNRLVDEMGFFTDFGDDWLRLGALKMAIDGGLTSKTALKSWPYLNEDQPRDVELRLDLSKLKQWVKDAHDAGWSVGIHVVGDLSQDEAVDAIYEAWKANPRDHRHQIIHAYYASPESLAKMAEAKIIAAVQPSFIYGEADGYDQLLPMEKQRSFLPLRTYLDAAIPTAVSTDMPSGNHNPFWNLYAAITRKGMHGYQLGSAECVTLTETLRMMTIEGAYLTGEEQQKGSLEPGKLADLVILDRNLLDTSALDLLKLKVELTMVDGEIAYQL